MGLENGGNDLVMLVAPFAYESLDANKKVSFILDQVPPNNVAGSAELMLI